MPHVTQLMVENINKGVQLSNKACKLQGGDVEGMVARLVETHRMLPHRLSGRQGGEVHSKLDLHTTQEDLSSTSLRSTPILVVPQVNHVLLTSLTIGHLGLIRRRSTICPGSRLIDTNRDKRTRRVASEMSPQPLTVKAHTKHHGPLPKVVAIKSDIREWYKSGQTKSSHGGR
jgi:hypothetical protein